VKVSISPNNNKGVGPNISLTPILSCGKDMPCTKKCYAVKAYRAWAIVRPAWDGNFWLYSNRPTEYFSQIAEYMEHKHPLTFRWHVGGDIPDMDYLVHMLDLARRFPPTSFLAFTKRYDLLLRLLQERKRLPRNLKIVASAWPEYPMPDAVQAGFPVAYIHDITENRIPGNARWCPGLCSTCGLCWVIRKDQAVFFDLH
jgi:hypothetical protein